MTLSDPTADLLTRLRNGKLAKHKYVDVNLSKLNRSIIDVLKETGFIHDFIVSDEKRKIRIFLKYTLMSKESVIKGLSRISKPGVRHYVPCQKIPRVRSGLGICILSTSKGVMDGEKAKTLNVGGEVLCYVW